MKKILKSNKLKIIAATFVAIFSLSAAFMGTIAWFSLNRNIGNDGASLEVNNVTGKLKKITFHKLSAKDNNSQTGAVEKFYFNKTPVGTFNYDWDSHSGSYVPTVEGDTSIQLDDYRPTDQEHPLMLLLELVDEYDASTDPVNVYATSTAEGFLGQRDEDTKEPSYPLATSVFKTISSTKYYALSSIASFSKKVFSDATFTTFNGINSTYDFCLTGSDVTSGENARFVLEDANRFTVVDNDAETSSFRQNIQLANVTSGNVKYIAIVIDYYIDAIEYIYSTFLGDETLELTYDYLLNFICDWSMEVY